MGIIIDIFGISCVSGVPCEMARSYLATLGLLGNLNIIYINLSTEIGSFFPADSHFNKITLSQECFVYNIVQNHNIAVCSLGQLKYQKKKNNKE